MNIKKKYQAPELEVLVQTQHLLDVDSIPFEGNEGEGGIGDAQSIDDQENDENSESVF